MWSYGVLIKKIKYFVSQNKNSSFEEWVKSLDTLAKVVVIRIIQRVASGGARKSVKALKDEVFEIKIPHGPGYRVYFAEDGEEMIILLMGGNKKTQGRDIIKAKEYWRSYGK